MTSNQYIELDRIDGEPMEFEWDIFPRFTTLQMFAEIQNMMTEIKCEPEQLQGRTIFMSIYNDIVWGFPRALGILAEKMMAEFKCESEHFQRRIIFMSMSDYARKFAHGHWSFLRSGSEKKWHWTHVQKFDGELDKIAEIMMLNFGESGHHIFRGSSAFIWKAKTEKIVEVENYLYISSM